MMQDGAGRLWTSLGQSPGLQMAWRRLPAFRSDMERRSEKHQERRDLPRLRVLNDHVGDDRRCESLLPLKTPSRVSK